MKALLIISFLYLPCVIWTQSNVIKVKKREEKRPEKKMIGGLYYSQPILQEYKSSGGVSRKMVRYYCYLSSIGEARIFTSKLLPEKVYQKFYKDPIKFETENGRFEVSDNDLFITSEKQNKSSRNTYRYVGKVYENEIYLNYKAAYKRKIALDIYLYRYSE